MLAKNFKEETLKKNKRNSFCFCFIIFNNDFNLSKRKISVKIHKVQKDL